MPVDTFTEAVTSSDYERHDEVVGGEAAVAFFLNLVHYLVGQGHLIDPTVSHVITVARNQGWSEKKTFVCLYCALQRILRHDEVECECSDLKGSCDRKIQYGLVKLLIKKLEEWTASEGGLEQLVA